MKKLIIALITFGLSATISLAQDSSAKSGDEKIKKQPSAQSQPAATKDSPLVQAAKKEQERRGKTKGTKTFTNQDIQDFKEKNKGTGWDTEDSDNEVVEETTTAEPEPASTERDLANDEQYWRNRRSEAAARLQAAQQNVERLQSEFNALNRAFYAESDGVAQRGKIGAEANERLELLEEAKKELQAATEAMANLEEEARRAGALPGWVRE